MTHESGYIFLVDADNRIVATGYNGAARGETECLEVGTCWRKENNVPHGPVSYTHLTLPTIA